MIGVVLLAKTLSPVLEAAIADAGLPSSFLGVIIAAIVLLPEGWPPSVLPPPIACRRA